MKRARGLPSRADKNIDLGYWIDRNFNTEENSSISRVQAGTREGIDALMLLPGIAEVHEKAIQWHREKFMELMQRESEHLLFSQILTVGSSQCPPAPITQKLISMYQPIYRAKQAEKQMLSVPGNPKQI